MRRLCHSGTGGNNPARIVHSNPRTMARRDVVVMKQFNETGIALAAADARQEIRAAIFEMHAMIKRVGETETSPYAWIGMGDLAIIRGKMEKASDVLTAGLKGRGAYGKTEKKADSVRRVAGTGPKRRRVSH